MLLHRGERGIDATHRYVEAEGDGVLEITALASSPDGMRRSSDALAPSLHLKPGGLGLHARHSLIVKRVALRPCPKLCGA